MTYRVAHTVEFKTLHNKMPVRLDITRLNYKKLPAERVARLKTALVIDDLEIDNDDKFTAIRGKRISAQLVARKGEDFGLNTLYSENPRQYRLESYVNGSLFARSYYLVGQSDEPYRSKPYDFSVKATVGLGDLKDTPYLDSSGVAYQAKQSAMEVLLNCLDLIGLELPVWVVCESFAEGMEESICSLSQTIIDPLRYYPEDQPMSAYQVLQDLCTLFGAFVGQANGVWVFVQVEQLRNDSVRVYRFDPNRKAYDPTRLSISKVIASGTKVADKPFIRYDQRIFNYDSVKLAQFDIEYGELKNWLYNARFQILDPKIMGGFTARGWRFFGLNYSFVTPDPQTVFKDNYLKIEGQLGNVDYVPINIPLVGNRKSNGPVGILNTWDVNSPVLQKPLTYDDQLAIGLPIVVRYDQVATATGEFFNVGTKGAKVQMVAVPIINQDVISPLRSNPQYALKRTDLAIGYELFYTNDGLWRPLTTNLNEPQAATLISRTVHIFENTREVRESAKEKDELGNIMPSTNREVTIAKGEWSQFSIETEKLPIATKETYNQVDPIVINGVTYKQFEFYAVRVVMFRGVEYENPKPSKPNPPSIMIRNLNMGMRNAGETADIRKERHEVEQNKKFGAKRDLITLPLGSTGGENYYSQLLSPQGGVLTRWYKSGDTANAMPLPALTLTDILRIYGRPTKRVTGSVAHALFDIFSSLRPGGLKGKYMLAGATQNLSEEESPVTLAELHDLLPSHKRRYYTVNASGKMILQSELVVEGDFEATEGDLFFTFFEPNGKSGNKIGITGSVWIAYPNSTIQLPAHYFTVAWHDALDDGPYEVIVESLLHGQGLGDYQKIYETSEMFATVEVSGDNTAQALKIRVRTNSGQEIQRPAIVTTQQEMQLTDVGRSCVGDFPAVSAVLVNGKVPTVIKMPLSNRVQNISPALYYAEVVNLATGEVVFATAKGSVIPSQTTLGIVVQMPEEWNSGVYGFRIIDGSFGADRCGIITQITRCTAKKPLLFNDDFTNEFYREDDQG